MALWSAIELFKCGCVTKVSDVSLTISGFLEGFSKLTDNYYIAPMSEFVTMLRQNNTGL